MATSDAAGNLWSVWWEIFPNAPRVARKRPRTFADSIGHVRTRSDSPGPYGTHADLKVAAGEVPAPPVGPTRKEEDFAAHLRQTLAVDLSVEGRRSILKSMKTRRCFLEEEAHRIRFVYTPEAVFVEALFVDE